MTTAKGVETSVNSPSQDYTNLDDQLPQTCSDTPEFKPFTFDFIVVQNIKELNKNFEFWFFLSKIK